MGFTGVVGRIRSTGYTRVSPTFYPYLSSVLVSSLFAYNPPSTRFLLMSQSSFFRGLVRDLRINLGLPSESRRLLDAVRGPNRVLQSLLCLFRRGPGIFESYKTP